MSEPLRCIHCGEVIGVYEPMTTVVDGRPVETSRAADAAAVPAGAMHYHRACFEQLGRAGEGAGTGDPASSRP
jgi:hypothetical protein